MSNADIDYDVCGCALCQHSKLVDDMNPTVYNNAVVSANQALDREPQHVQHVFILTDAEQAELMDYLWPQWINPNDWPNLKSLLNRLEQARKA